MITGPVGVAGGGATPQHPIGLKLTRWFEQGSARPAFRLEVPSAAYAAQQPGEEGASRPGPVQLTAAQDKGKPRQRNAAGRVLDARDPSSAALAIPLDPTPRFEAASERHKSPP